MNIEAKELRELVERTEREFESAKKELKQYEDKCPHEFQVTYDPVHHGGYYSPGDPPETSGVDRQLPCWVSASTEDRWRRECRRCGLVEYTNYFKEEQTVKKIPDWPMPFRQR